MTGDTAIIMDEKVLYDLRRQLISQLRIIEDALGLPPEKRAVQTRKQRRANSGMTAASED